MFHIVANLPYGIWSCHSYQGLVCACVFSITVEIELIDGEDKLGAGPVEVPCKIVNENGDHSSVSKLFIEETKKFSVFIPQTNLTVLCLYAPFRSLSIKFTTPISVIIVDSKILWPTRNLKRSSGITLIITLWAAVISETNTTKPRKKDLSASSC